MKKNGFTLSEVLITLGIIGIVAALTIPTLSGSTKSSSIGPRLAKAASMFDQASSALLNANDADSVIALGINNNNDFANALSDYLKIEEFEYPGGRPSPSSGYSDLCGNPNNQFKNQPAYLSKDGIVYLIGSNWTVTSYDDGLAPHKQPIGKVYIDINAAKGPNAFGNDLFEFYLMNDGSLKPMGSRLFGTKADEVETACGWKNKCPNGSTPTSAASCTASIFANGLKVEYTIPSN